MKTRLYFSFILVLMLGLSTLMVTAATQTADLNFDFSDEMIFFIQADHDGKTLYYIENNCFNPVKIISGTEIEVFSDKKHLLFFCDQQLYRFDLKTKKNESLAVFNEKKLYINFIDDSNDLEQALILAEDSYTINYYIVDLTDFNIRKLAQPLKLAGASSREVISISPNGLNRVRVKFASKRRFETIVEVNEGSQYKVKWKLPRELTVLPELPFWAPDSNKIAFYAKDITSGEGFYSLYIYLIITDQLQKVHEQVFPKMFFSDPSSGGFRPNWYNDGNSIMFEYLPYGLPTRSAIISYQLATGKSITLTESQGENQYPQWSPSGRQIIFLSNRDSKSFQLFIMNNRGESIKKISPDDGYTEWAEWIEY